MKTKNLLVIGMALFLVTACQKEEETPNVETAQETELTVKYIAENYHNKELTEDEIIKVADAYTALDTDEMKDYFQYAGDIMKSKGMDASEVDTKVQMLQKVNEALFQETGKSFAQADIADRESVMNKFSLPATEKEVKNGQNATNRFCPTWNSYGANLRFYYQPNYRNSSLSISSAGIYNVGGNSSDCDNIFRSQAYGTGLRAQYIVYETAAAYNALRGYVYRFGRLILDKRDTSTAKYEYYTTSARASITTEFLVGFGRVRGNYILGGPLQFADEVRLVVR